jgi:serine/threonine protein kinase
MRVTSGCNLGWRRGEKLGAGSYGCVYKAQRLDGSLFAVKKAAAEQIGAVDTKCRERLEEELRIVQGLQHPHIVCYMGHDWMDGFLYLYLEYVAGGSMQSVLNEFGPLELPMLHSATKGMLEGLEYLHSRNPPVVHRDIKCANLLVDANFCVKLADFGCSKQHEVTQSFTTIGSIPWMAPEVIVKQDGHGRKADVWSCGCVCIEMATAEKPWGKNFFDNPFHALHHIGSSTATPPIPPDLPGDIIDLISRCLQRTPEDRPSVQTLLKHSFLQDGDEGNQKKAGC